MNQILSRANKTSVWFSDYGHPTEGTARIFAFPYSGAGASAFYHWAQDLRDTDVDFLGFAAPGREVRTSEALINQMPDLIEQLLPEMQAMLDKPFVIFGHSLGGLTAFELTRALQSHGLPMPQHLFISAIRVPNRPSPNPTLHHLPDKAFMQAVNSYGGTSQALLDNPELMQLFIPILRNDFIMSETYEYRAEPLLQCPITVFSGAEDPYAKPDFMALWHEQTADEFHQVIYSGNHFFLHEHRADMLQRLQRGLV